MISGRWEQILTELEEVDIVVLLISPDLMASDFCFKIEMKKALIKYKDKGHLLIPVVIREIPSWKKYEIG